MEYLSIKQTSESGESPSEGFKSCVRRSVSLMQQRLDHIGLFRLMPRSRMTRELGVEDMLRTSNKGRFLAATIEGSVRELSLKSEPQFLDVLPVISGHVESVVLMTRTK